MAQSTNARSRAKKEFCVVVLDFAKAFDTLEWSFSKSCLKLFHFGENIVSIMSLFQRNTFSGVEKNGHLSSNIPPSRGYRQGDPVSCYLFVISAEILAEGVSCDGVNDIKVMGSEIKLSLYADDIDTAGFLNGQVSSLNKLLHILKWYRKVSGLGINNEKTKMAKIGDLRGRSIPWESKYRFWVDQFFWYLRYTL